jgi:hypothetical protein
LVAGVKLIQTSVVLVVFAAASCRRAAEPASKPDLSAEDLRAIAAAEEFLRKHGYTDQAHDPVALERESRGRGEPVEFILRLRRNRTLGKAYGLSRNVGGHRGWTVYFAYNGAYLRELAMSMRLFRQWEELPWSEAGMAVEVSPDLTKLVVPHLDICLGTAEVVLRPSTSAPEPRPRAVEGWTVQAVDDLREVVVRRLLGSSCAALPESALPVCIEVDEPASGSKRAKNGCGGRRVDRGHASNDLVARLQRGTKRAVLPAAACIDLAPRIPHLALTIHPLQRRRAGDAELLVYVTMYASGSRRSPAPFQYFELEASAMLQRAGWVLSRSKVVFLELPPRESGDMTARTAGCS